jgi:hypothetical protein
VDSDLSDSRRSGPVPTAGMPAAPADVIYEYDRRAQQIIVMNWASIGHTERQRCRQYIDGARLSRTRRRRCERAAEALLKSR